jgi:hypothetical protein
MRASVVDERSEDITQFVANVWVSWSPFKVNVFSWQLLQDRVSTRQNIFSKRIIVDPGGISCIFCNEIVESVCHLF